MTNKLEHMTYTAIDRLSFSFSDNRREKIKAQDVQLTLPPPPRHCPHGTIAERPPRAALGRLVCTRVVREPGARWVGKRVGCVCAGSLYVVGPASRTRMRRLGFTAARRPATMQPAAPPVRFTQKRWRVEVGDNTHHLR